MAQMLHRKRRASSGAKNGLSPFTPQKIGLRLFRQLPEGLTGNKNRWHCPRTNVQPQRRARYSASLSSSVAVRRPPEMQACAPTRAAPRGDKRDPPQRHAGQRHQRLARQALRVAARVDENHRPHFGSALRFGRVGTGGRGCHALFLHLLSPIGSGAAPV